VSYSEPPPPPYGAPQPPYGAAPQEHPRGTIILVLGILGLLCCGILAIPAVVMGKTALSEIDAAPPGSYSNRGTVKAGFICGIIGLALWAVGIVVNLLLLTF
jgi:hypothetical protein